MRNGDTSLTFGKETVKISSDTKGNEDNVNSKIGQLFIIYIAVGTSGESGENEKKKWTY